MVSFLLVFIIFALGMLFRDLLFLLYFYLGGLVQTIIGKINIIVTLRISPPPPLPLMSRNELIEK